MSQTGKIALVTAASRGLGRGCAEQLAAEGCRVAICARDDGAVKKAAKEIADRRRGRGKGFAGGAEGRTVHREGPVIARESV